MKMYNEEAKKDIEDEMTKNKIDFAEKIEILNENIEEKNQIIASLKEKNEKSINECKEITALIAYISYLTRSISSLFYCYNYLFYSVRLSISFV